MSRYNVPTGVQGEYEPGSRRKVLRNLLGIRTKAEMDRAERSALEDAQTQYYTDDSVTAETVFTATLIRKMHRDWLGGIYAWAGDYRTVDMSKGDFVFPPAYLVSLNMERFERAALAEHTPCRPSGLEEVSRSLAIVHSELLLVHPFREGNGRIARWLANIMAVQAGLPTPLYGFTGKGSRQNREEYLRAVVKGYGQDYDELAGFFERALARRLLEPSGAARSARGEAPSNTDDS